MTKLEVPAGARLATYSGLILFFELALIRLTAGYVHVFSFYLNFVLIATFLGMGVGLLRAGDAAKLKWLALPAILLLLGAVRFYMGATISVPSDENEFLWGIFAGGATRSVPLLVVAVSLFALCALFFVPLGALAGEQFRKLPPLVAYGWDIGGGLVGILVFGLLSSAERGPLVWLLIGFLAWLAVSATDRRFAIGLLVTGTAALWVTNEMATTEGKSIWSPYYRISIIPLGHASQYQVNVNGSLHQILLDLDSLAAEKDPYARTARAGYVEPYRLLTRLDTALVVGAGTGNDVSLLLQRGAKYVDAVEIDPVIADIGEALHAHKPYSDPRVHLHVNDARAFLRTTHQKYDLVVFGTLDSQTLLSGMSSVRLDNYVYTEESFRAARAHLTPDGSLFVYHMSPRAYIAAKIFKMIGDAFGQSPGVIGGNYNLFNVIFVAGAAASRAHDAPANLTADLAQPVSPPTDDWPYLYLRERVLPAHYIAALLGVLLVAAVMIGVAGRGVIGHGVDWTMAFMGAGFMLVETKSVTEMSLLFGSTWTVNLLVFSSIMVMVLVANLVIRRTGAMSLPKLFGGLFAALAIAYLLPASRLLGLGSATQWIVGGLMVALPIFFASLIFSSLLGGRAEGARALGYNLIGAIAGGVLEYSSMVIGIKGLYVVAALLYLMAMLFALRGKGMQSAPSSS